MTGEISPVNAPSTSWCMFWAARPIPQPATASATATSAVAGGPSTTSRLASASPRPARTSRARRPASAAVLYIFQLPARSGRRRPATLGLLQAEHARQRIAGQELEGGAAPGGDVADLRRQAHLGDGGHAVPAADHRGPLAVGDRLCHRPRPFGGGLHLEHAHGAAPADHPGLAH